jgi:hypothetical protein
MISSGAQREGLEGSVRGLLAGGKGDSNER